MREEKHIVVKPIKIFDPVISQNEEFAIKKVLQSHQWALGNGNGLVSKFEKKFNQLIGSSSCVAVDSGTSAINLALSAIGVKDKEVILPSLCYVSVAHAVVLNGGIPIFADIDPVTLNIDPNSIEEKIQSQDLDKNILICGLSYKANVEDMRDSPSFKIIQEMKLRGFTIFAFDPYFDISLTEKYLIENLETDLQTSGISSWVYDSLCRSF